MGLRDSKITVKNECITCLFITIDTILFSCLLYLIFDKAKELPTHVNWYYGFGFGCATGFLFMICFIIAGGMKNSTHILIERWVDFFENLRISLGFAFSSLFTHIKNEGMAFWLYILLMAAQIGVSYYCLANLAALYL